MLLVDLFGLDCALLYISRCWNALSKFQLQFECQEVTLPMLAEEDGSVSLELTLARPNGHVLILTRHLVC